MTYAQSGSFHRGGYTSSTTADRADMISLTAISFSV
jgi:hypothetical protein